MHIIKILTSPDWERADRLGILHTHPKFHAVAAAVVAQLRQKPGHSAALTWCIAKLRPCSKVYPSSPFASTLHHLFERDTGVRIDEGVFEIAAAEAGLPVDCPPGRERLRIGAHQVDVRRIERRVAANARWPMVSGTVH